MPSPRIGGGAALIIACALAVLPASAQIAPAASVQSAPAAPAQPVPSGPAQATPPGTESFGQEVVLPPRRIVYLQGQADWDRAFDALVDAYKSVYGYLKGEGLEPAGKAMTIYTQADDTGFQYRAAVPIAAEPKKPPQGDLRIGDAPSGKALKFVHHGPYDEMDATYEAVTNYLDDKNVDAGDLFIEEYQTDLLQTPEDKLVINIYVPLK